VCPLCSQPVVPLPSQDPNLVLDEHISRGCPKTGLTGYKCNLKGCKTRDVVPFLCKNCRLHHCVRHRFEDDHSCSRKPQKQKMTPANFFNVTNSPSSSNVPPSRANNTNKANKTNNANISNASNTNNVRPANPSSHASPNSDHFNTRQNVNTSSAVDNNNNNNNNNNNSYPGNYNNNNDYLAFAPLYEDQVIANPNLYSFTENTSNSNSNSNSNNNNNAQHRASSPNNPPPTYNEATIGIRLTNGEVLRQSFSTTSKLRDVQNFIDQRRTDGYAPYVMRTTYPPKEFSFEDLDSTLAQLGLVPSGMIILHHFEAPRSSFDNAASTTSTRSDLGWWGLVSSFVGSFIPPAGGQ